MASKTVKVYEILVDGPGEGPAGDGTRVVRFRNKVDATKFAGANTCYGRPATVSETDAPRHVAQRWGMA